MLAHPAGKLLVLPIFFAAIVLRDPSLFDSPRFWAEEGTNYFSWALRGSWFEALTRLKTTPHAAYLNPVPHLSTFVAARFVPLEWAPATTTAVWSAFMLTLAVIALYGRGPALSSPWRRAVVLAIPLVVTNNGENWANTIGVHYVCDFAILLLLMEAPEATGMRRTASLVAIGLCAAVSQTSWLLFPAVLFLYLRNVETYRKHFMIIGAATALHLIVAVALHEPGARPENALVAVPHVVLLKMIIWPFAGWDAADSYGALAVGLDPTAFDVAAALVMLHLIALAVGVFFLLRWEPYTIAIVVTYGAVVFAYAFLGLGVGRGHLSTYNAGRYAWLPNAILMLLLVHQIDPDKLRKRETKQLVLAVALAATVVVGVVDYRHPTAPHGPSWRREVLHFRSDPEYKQLRIAPKGWVVEIAPEFDLLR
jgi:hypothetical protein